MAFLRVDSFKSQSFVASENAIKLSKGVTKIGNGSFYNCGLLSYIVIPSTVTYIGEDAFKYSNNTPLNCKVYYKGKKDQTNTISMQKSYTNVVDWYYYSESNPGDASGKYWYYNNGVITSWNGN